MASISELEDIANILRRDSLISTTAAGSGHPSSCLSCAEIMSCLFFEQMKYDHLHPEDDDNDEFILSKGHASPILYSALKHSGCIHNDLNTLRNLSSPLQGHPVPSLPFVKFATGSLGQGLSIGLGVSLAQKIMGKKAKTYVLLGDSELAEGQNYEAFQLASFYKLKNLIAIADINRLGQTKETMLGWDLDSYKKRFDSFGWHSIIIDGHNVKQILYALKKAQLSSRPTIILARTTKGKGVPLLENKNGWHGRVLSKSELSLALFQIPNPKPPVPHISLPHKSEKIIEKKSKLFLPIFQLGEEVSTREAYGKSLASLALSNPHVISVDAEVSNSTYTEEVFHHSPYQFIEAFIAEQNMVSLSLGLSKKGFNVFASTFSSFLSRAFDQIRMSAISKGDFTLSGSHSGVSIGPDGASQMGLEDISLFRSIPNSIVLYPSDAVSTSKLVLLASKEKGIKYLRLSRPKLPVLYKKSEKFPLGDFKVLRKTAKDKLVLIGSGVTLHESIKAYAFLKKHKIPVSVIDLYCIKPLNEKKLVQFIKSHGNRVIITEDHYKEGGIGEAILSAIKNTDIKFSHLSVNEIPHSGTEKELLNKYKISYNHIIDEAKKIIK